MWLSWHTGEVRGEILLEDNCSSVRHGDDPAVAAIILGVDHMDGAEVGTDMDDCSTGQIGGPHPGEDHGIADRRLGHGMPLDKEGRIHDQFSFWLGFGCRQEDVLWGGKGESSNGIEIGKGCNEGTYMRGTMDPM